MPTIIDMRNRPRILHAFFGGEPGTPAFETVRWLGRRVGARDPYHFAAHQDLADHLAAMDGAGIDKAVIVARSTPDVRVTNEAVAKLVGDGRGRLVGIASVDPVELGREAALGAARHAIQELGLAGVNLDAGFWATPLAADDERLLPIYALCAELAVPAFIMSGPTTPDLRLNDPLAIDRVARLFPDLAIVVSHGAWPRVAEMIAVAFRNENVFVSPDMYMFAPGGRLYVEAANGFMERQLLFGSSYPFRPMRQSVEDCRQLGLGERALEAALTGNARRLLGLP